jgi:hypothetical protein
LDSKLELNKWLIEQTGMKFPDVIKSESKQSMIELICDYLSGLYFNRLVSKSPEWIAKQIVKLDSKSVITDQENKNLNNEIITSLIEYSIFNNGNEQSIDLENKDIKVLKEIENVKINFNN